MQEQLVEPRPVPQVEDEQKRAEGNRPGSHHRAIPRDPRVGRLVLLPQIGGERRNEKNTGGKAAQEKVVDDQDSPLDVWHALRSLQQVVDLWSVAGLRLLDAVLARRQKLLQLSRGICNVTEGSDLRR